jgi:hypothetical protein
MNYKGLRINLWKNRHWWKLDGRYGTWRFKS